ncbi:hypothetical protein [Terasakiella sp. SH-1]|uniref:hypothetical protein n=1 Tax=Terasakiella sp. SH-1 TaxID=2560057 RepID=UPI001073E150|nr:hypothetical protein [Terasakiella sp. SH-1]
MKKLTSALCATAFLCLVNPASADYAVATVTKAKLSEYNEAFQTRVAVNDGPCRPEIAPEAKDHDDGHYIALYPTGPEARSWKISFRQVNDKTEVHLGDGMLPLLYGVTYNGEHLVSHVLYKMNDKPNTYQIGAMHPIWTAMMNGEWACFYLPGANFEENRQ